MILGSICDKFDEDQELEKPVPDNIDALFQEFYRRPPNFWDPNLALRDGRFPSPSTTSIQRIATDQSFSSRSNARA
jgi:hypothetical protein